MRRLAPWILVLALALGLGREVLGEEGTPAPAPAPARGELTGRVVAVVDGDTIRVEVGGRTERVRYIGMDTPESVKPGTPVQCFAKAASAENARLVGGRRVRLELDAEERDRFGRLLAYVRRDGDGLFVNAELVRRGFATQLTVPPNVRYAERLRTLAGAARAAGRGLWGRCPSRAANG